MLRYLLLLLFIVPIHLNAAQCPSIRANGPSGWEPISYRNGNGQLIGMAVEVAKKVFFELGIELIFEKDIPWKRQQLHLENGSLDVIISAYFNEQRAKKFTYSNSYHIEKIRVFVRADKIFEFNSLDNLKGKFGLRPLGGTYGDEFDEFASKHLNISEYSDRKSNMYRLYRGQKDYIILALLDGLISVKKYGYRSKIVPLPKDVAQLPIYFMFSKKSPCEHILKRVNTAIKELVKNNFIKNLEDKYMQQLK